MANWKKRYTERVGAFRLITAPLLIIVAALPFVVAGIWVVNFAGPWVWHHTLHHHVIRWSPGLPAWLGTYLSTWNWQPFIIGIIAGLVVHRLYRPIGNTVQLFFIERAVARTRRTGRVPVWVRHPLRPAGVRGRDAWVMENEATAARHGCCGTTVLTLSS